jgi:hypothetical protein
MRNFIAGAGLLSVLNAIDLSRTEESLYIRHVNSQEACDNFNIFNADRYEFNQEYCACFIREENYPGEIAQCEAPRLTNPVDLDECIAQCQMDEALNHGLDANCNIPRDENDAIHKHARGWHKHLRDTDCNGRVVHNYKRVVVAPEFEIPDYQTYIDQQSQYMSDLDFDHTVTEPAAEAGDAGTEAAADEIVQDATEPDTGAEVDSDAQE